MKTYKLADGGTIAATSPETFVIALRKSSKFDSDCSNKQYMEHFADRYKVQTGIKIKTDSPELFIEELIRSNYMQEIK